MASVDRLRTRAWPAFWLAACSLLLAVTEPSVSAPEEVVGGFDVRFASARLVDGVYMVDADIELAFSQDALEAIENGIPVTIIFEMQVLRARRYWFDQTTASIEVRHRIETRALSDTYIVRNLSSGEARAYSSFPDVLKGLGKIRDFPLIDSYLLDPKATYTLRLRALLDIEALPSPMRPLAYLSSLWRLKSDWYEWPLKS